LEFRAKGYRLQATGFRFSVRVTNRFVYSGFKVEGTKYIVWGLRFRVQGSGHRAQSIGHRAQGT
jgi:hypothetical protein